ncbi:exodeoxyribonuclease I [Alteromonas sp. 14N.309.X.WAT.G.H12]|uniref:exodeoxyribonuclease I n=1 Tax=Alteromonas sp. 14N.309.X.WAT.G.H12 TaxID=3120824 RepID=UPI002FD38347
MSLAFENACSEIKRTASTEHIKKAYQDMSDEYRSMVKEDVFVRFFEGPNRNTILWHDYEAGGISAKQVPPLQFAAVRTDMELNIIDLPIDIYCKLDCDRLPHPQAIAITKINPMKCVTEGLPEPEFFRHINREMSLPNTCVCGYNSMNYDDEVTRFGLWRSLIPVYEREFRNGNSRWDLLPVMATFASLGIPGVIVPVTDEGETTLKLEAIAAANDITQENAHNAVDDVYALIGLAKLLKRASPLLWDYLYDGRRKKTASGRCLTGMTGMLYSPMMGAEHNYGKPVLILGPNPQNRNAGRVYLELDDVTRIRQMWKMPLEAIRENVFKKKQDHIEAGSERPPLSTLKINNSPAFFPFNWLVKEGFIDDESPVILADKIASNRDFISKLLAVFELDSFPEEDDPELMLYGGFPSDGDKGKLARLSSQPIVEAFAKKEASFDDPSLNLIYLNARARLRDYPGITLSNDDKGAWQFYCASLQIQPIDESNPKGYVNLTNAEKLLAKTEMDDALRGGYKEYLSYVRQQIGPSLP